MTTTNTETSTKKKNLLVIDTDGGTDDCHGILIAAADDDTEILAITCVFGNVDVDQACNNVLRTVHLSDKLRSARCPIYKGANKPLAGFPFKRSNVHGEDGLGNADEQSGPELDTGIIQSEPACMALIRIVDQYPGQVSVAAIGPLTNLALATRIDPSFSSKIKDLVIMGGDSEGRGNISPCAEFNFLVDPEAARVVLHEFECPKSIISWELTMKIAWDMDWMSENLFAVDNERGRFLRDVHVHIFEMCREQMTKEADGMSNRFPPCDQAAVSVAIKPALVTAYESCRCSVEVGGVSSRGHLVIDRACLDPAVEGAKPTKIVIDLDVEELKLMAFKSVHN